ncbi:monooxygenase-like protein [Schizothecium vesticola]|uniref:Monooxygenase-like protein n=1 Tax=Schizothecium vesticola TaxID=314040 RepID=A0AA40BQG5_9PEZI|nr:monooxygenase-like protein [Schizothecium vesticola]
MSRLVDLAPTSTPATAAVAVACVLLAILIKAAYFPSLDSREPPLVRSTVPFIGHILGLMQHESDYFTRLVLRRRLPIGTLPMLNGKVYLISSPTLVAAAFRSRDLSFSPFALEFSGPLLDVPPRDLGPERWGAPGWMETMETTIHAALAGEKLRAMKAACYREVARIVNDEYGPGKGAVRIADPMAWLEEVIPRAFTRALFGRGNPFGKEAIRAIWDFDASVGILALGIAPRLLAPKGYAARRLLQDTITPWYEAGRWRDEDVSALLHDRAAKVEREATVPMSTLCRTEINIPWASVTNTVPDMFWLLLNVFSRPRVLARFREEAEELVTVVEEGGGRRRATVAADRLMDKAYIASTYWETHRLYNDNIGNRRVMRDTVLRDTTDGREYFLKKGINVQLAVGPSHRDPAIWGPDADEFRPERWLGATGAEEKRLRAALIPFGGGRNLCPGKSFAISEALGMLAVWVVGYDVEGAQVPRDTAAPMANTMRKPDWGGKDPAITMKRREEWEDVEWGFVVHDETPSY